MEPIWLDRGSYTVSTYVNQRVFARDFNHQFHVQTRPEYLLLYSIYQIYIYIYAYIYISIKMSFSPMDTYYTTDKYGFSPIEKKVFHYDPGNIFPDSPAAI